MLDFVVQLADKPEEMKSNARRRVDSALERGARIKQWGTVDGFCLCSDYCFNDNPFLSPAMFDDFVAPYLKQLVTGYRELGFYVIKHTDPATTRISWSEPPRRRERFGARLCGTASSGRVTPFAANRESRTAPQKRISQFGSAARRRSFSTWGSGLPSSRSHSRPVSLPMSDGNAASWLFRR